MTLTTKQVALIFSIGALAVALTIAHAAISFPRLDAKPKLVLGLFEARDKLGADEFEQKLRLQLAKRGLENLFSNIEYVTEHGPYLPSIDGAAKRLAQKKPDILIAITTTNAVSLAKFTDTIPIVFNAYRDPIALGLVETLSSPKKNLTGYSFFLPLHLKRWELLKELNPKLERIGVLLDQEFVPANLLEDLKMVRETLGVEVVPIYVPFESDLQYLAKELVSKRIDALDLPHLGHLVMDQKQTTANMLKLKVLTSYEGELNCKWGGHVCYGRQNLPIENLFADYIAILATGGKPQSTPVSTPTSFDFVLNTTSLKSLNLTPSAAMLTRATLYE